MATRRETVASLQSSGGAEERAALSSGRDQEHRISPRWQPAIAIFGLALCLRLIFSLLLAGVFDKDEFVYLALGHDVGTGAVPYTDFGFFHPPGILVLIGWLNSLTALWWPLARLIDVLIDSFTAVLVWYVGTHLYGRRLAVVAGVLYAVNPTVLVSAVRVDQEIVITALGIGGIALLVAGRTSRSALLAGACLGIACWIKYPAALFLPVYLIAARRRLVPCLLGFSVVAALLFLSYLGHIHQLYYDTVTWQTVHRYHTPLSVRLERTAIFWLLINPFAVVALFVIRRPLWLITAFATGGVFIFTSSTYAHYFVPVAPFAALLGAPIAARLVRLPPRAVVLACVGVTVGWAELLLHTSQDYVPMLSFSSVRPVIQMIDRSTAPSAPILSDRFEYAYLAGRPWIAHYFWDDHDMISSQTLEHHLTSTGSVVLFPSNGTTFFPPGLINYLDAHYAESRVAGASVWLIDRPRGSNRG